jgi:hypothetical protein
MSEVIEHETACLTGQVKVRVFDAAREAWFLEDPSRLIMPANLWTPGLIQEFPWTSNKVVANSVAGFGNGLNLVRDFLAATFPQPPTHVAWGTNGTSPQETDVGLYEEQVRNSIVSRARGHKQLIIAGFMGSATGNGFTFREAAIVTGATDTQWRLLARVAMNPIAKNSNTIITLNWQLDLS